MLRHHKEPSAQFLGAVGTGANRLLLGNSLDTFSSGVRGQTYPRQHDLRVAQEFSDIAATLHKMAFDLRLMFSDGLIYFDRGDREIGSSAMPGKKNPIGLEKICGLARRMPHIVSELWDISALSLLERTLDDSSPRRSLLPEMFLLMSEIITTMTKQVERVRLYTGWASSRVKIMGWRSWVPSRVQTILRAKDIDITQAELVQLAAACETPRGYLLKIQEEYSLDNDVLVYDDPDFVLARDHIHREIRWASNPLPF
jgi:adenylosuccinate lyase